MKSIYGIFFLTSFFPLASLHANSSELKTCDQYEAEYKIEDAFLSCHLNSGESSNYPIVEILISPAKKLGALYTAFLGSTGTNSQLNSYSTFVGASALKSFSFSTESGDINAEFDNYPLSKKEWYLGDLSLRIGTVEPFMGKTHQASSQNFSFQVPKLKAFNKIIFTDAPQNSTLDCKLKTEADIQDSFKILEMNETCTQSNLSLKSKRKCAAFSLWTAYWSRQQVKPARVTSFTIQDPQTGEMKCFVKTE
jgi:hypothetical protein